MVQSFDEQLMLGRREWLILSDNNKPEPVGPDNKPLRDKPIKKELREPSKIDNEFFDDSNIAGYMGQDEDVEQAQYNVMSLIEDKFGGLNKQIDRISKELETSIGKNKDDISELKGELCIPFLKDKCSTKTKQGCMKCADYYKELNQLPEDCYDPGLLNMHCQYTNTYTNSENEGADISQRLAIDLDNPGSGEDSDILQCDSLEHFDCKAVIEDNYNNFQSNADKLCLWDEEGKQYNKPIIVDDPSSLNIKCRNLCNSYTDENECENKEGCFYSEGNCVEKICENRMNSGECQLNEGVPENERCGVSNYGFSVSPQNSAQEDSNYPFFENWRRWFGIYPKNNPEINTCVMKDLKSDGTFVEKGSPPQQYTQTEEDYCLSDIDPTNTEPDANDQSSNVGYFISSDNAINDANRGVTPNSNGPSYSSIFNYDATNPQSGPNILPYCRTSENIRGDTHILEGGHSITGTVNCISDTNVNESNESNELSSIDEYSFGSNPASDTDNPCNQNNLNRDYENSQSSESEGEGSSGNRSITELYNDQSCELRESDYLSDGDISLKNINFGKICEGKNNSSGCYYGNKVTYEGPNIKTISFGDQVCKSKPQNQDNIPCNLLKKDSDNCENPNKSPGEDGKCYKSNKYCYPNRCKNIDTSKFTSVDQACNIGVDPGIKIKIDNLNSLCVPDLDNIGQCKDEPDLLNINETVEYIKKADQYTASFFLGIVVFAIIICIILVCISQFLIPGGTPDEHKILSAVLVLVYIVCLLINYFRKDPLHQFFANYSTDDKCNKSGDTLYDKMKQYMDCLDNIDPQGSIKIQNMNDGSNPKFIKTYDYLVGKSTVNDSELKYEYSDCWRIHVNSIIYLFIFIAIVFLLLGGYLAYDLGVPGQASGWLANQRVMPAFLSKDIVKFGGFILIYLGMFIGFFFIGSNNTIKNGDNTEISDYRKVPESIRKELGIFRDTNISKITICESENLPYSQYYKDNKNIYDLFYKELTKSGENKYAYNWNTSPGNIVCIVLFILIGIFIILTLIPPIRQSLLPQLNLLNDASDITRYAVSVFMVILLVVKAAFISDNFDPFKGSGFTERTDIDQLCSGDNELDTTDLPNPPNKIGTYYDKDNSILPVPSNGSDLGTTSEGSCKIDNNDPDRGSFCDIDEYSQDIEGNSAKENITNENSNKYCIPYSKWFALVNAKITGDDSNINNYKNFLKQQVLFNTHLKKITNDSGIKNQNLAFDYEMNNESNRGSWTWIFFWIVFTLITGISLYGGYTILSGLNGGAAIGIMGRVIYVLIGLIELFVVIYVSLYYNYTTDYIKRDFVEIITSSYNEVEGKSYEERGDCSACYAKKQNTNTGDYELIKINIPPGSRKSKSYECDKFNGCLVNELKDFNPDNGGDHICKGKGFTEDDISKVNGFNTDNCDINVGDVSINIDDMYYYNDGLPGDYRDLDGVWKNNITDPETDKTKLIKNLDSNYRSWYIDSWGDFWIMFSSWLILAGIALSYRANSQILVYISFAVGNVYLVLLLMYYTYDYNDTIDILNGKLKPEQGFVKDGQIVTKFRKINYPFFFFGANMETDDNRLNCKISTTPDKN